jgi:hypothetical protein
VINNDVNLSDIYDTKKTILLNKESDLYKERKILDEMLETIQQREQNLIEKNKDLENREKLFTELTKKHDGLLENREKILKKTAIEAEKKASLFQKQINENYQKRLNELMKIKKELSELFASITSDMDVDNKYISEFYKKYNQPEKPYNVDDRLSELKKYEEKIIKMSEEFDISKISIPNIDITELNSEDNIYQISINENKTD